MKMNHYVFGYIMFLFASRIALGIDVEENVINDSSVSPTVLFDRRNSSHSILVGTINETDPARVIRLEKNAQKSDDEDFHLNQNRLQSRILDRRKSENKEEVDSGNHAREDSISYRNESTDSYQVLMSYKNSSTNLDGNSVPHAFANDSLILQKSKAHDMAISMQESPASLSNVSLLDSQIENSTSDVNVYSKEAEESLFFGDDDKLNSFTDHQADWREFLHGFEGHNSSNFCRTRHGRFLPPQLFSWDSCAYCYVFEIRKYDRGGPWKTRIMKHELGREIFEILFLFNITELNGSTPQVKLLPAIPSKKLFESVPDLKFRENWQKCCDAAVNCCHKMLKMPEINSSNMCPRTWDGWQCWKDALPNTEVFEPCPDYIYIDTEPTCKKLAVKRCEEGGRWYRKNLNEWSNYSPCGVLPKIQLRITFHLVALSLSVLVLTPALLIFCCYRQLRVHRITLHKHLFISLLLEACCTIAFQLLQLYHVDIISENNLWCVALTLVRRYARQTNYMWYLCEGYYLHKLLAAAFAEQRSLDIFYLIGWGFPLLPIAVYATIRGQMYQNSHCWELPIADIEWLMQLPPLLAILINFIFLVNIIRILLSKVRAGHDNEPCQYRMAVRATLMVIPLFGLQYIVTIYRPKGQTCDWLDVYHIINNVIDGSTGFVVAVIFCFANGEVRNLLRRSWKRKREKPPPFGSTRSSRNSFPFGSRSLSTIQTTYVNTTANPSRRASSIISMGFSSHFGSKSILKSSGTNMAENQRSDNTKRAERIQKARSVSQILDIVKINESNYSLKFINNKPINRSNEEEIGNYREASSNFKHHRPNTISNPDANLGIYGHYIPMEDENITFIDDECSLSGESQQLTLGEIIYNNSRIGKSKQFQTGYMKENRMSNMKIEEDAM